MGQRTPTVHSIRQSKKHTPFDGTEFEVESQPISIPPLRHESKSFIGDAELEAFLRNQDISARGVKDLVEKVKELGSINLYINCRPIPW